MVPCLPLYACSMASLELFCCEFRCCPPPVPASVSNGAPADIPEVLVGEKKPDWVCALGDASLLSLASALLFLLFAVLPPSFAFMERRSPVVDIFSPGMQRSPRCHAPEQYA